jgi:hypothetical protein
MGGVMCKKCKKCSEGRVTGTRRRMLEKGEYVLPYGVKPTKKQKMIVGKKCGGLDKKKKKKKKN